MIPNDPHHGQPLPNPGLPEDLPLGEAMLWQGGPRWQNLALRVFHVRKVLAWFGFLLLWGFAARLSEGQPAAIALATPGVWLAPMALAAAAILLLLAWLTAQNAHYTITSKRLVLRIGIAFTVAINVPFSAIDAADLKLNGDGTGDLALTLRPDAKIAWVILWPHCRPWRMGRPQPTLRAIAEPQRVAAILGRAVAQSAPGGVTQKPFAMPQAPAAALGAGAMR